MNITLVNASHWDVIEQDENIRCVSGYPVRHRMPYEKIYLPFALVHFDKQRGQITAVRDHFGQEPLYYAYRPPYFIFGSTIPDILKHLPSPPKFTPHLLRDCFLRIPVDDPVDDPPYTTETYYEGVFRVTPGHVLYIDDTGQYESSYWSLNPDHPPLNYADEREYVEQFEMLLKEAIRVTTAGERRLAAEFSGGMDSTALFVACRQIGLAPTLFTHVPPHNRRPTCEDMNVKRIIQQFNWTEKHYSIDASRFEPMAVFRYFAMWFAGPPPNLNSVLSNNVHQAMIEHDYHVVLSGFGGDDCVSLRYPPDVRANLKTLRQYEYDLLQGKLSHEMRMRLEYNAVTAKAMKLRYVYPLLYPPLVEFCFSMPVEQKIKQGKMRCTMQQYLSRHVVKMKFSTKDGAVVPSTMQKCRDDYAQGLFSHEFESLPFQQYLCEARSRDDEMLLRLHAWMYQYYWRATEAGPENPVPPESTQLLNSPVFGKIKQRETVFETALGT